MKKVFKHLLISSLAFLNLFNLFAQKNKVVIEANKGELKISRHIYGHFAEHLGRCIYGGIWVGENSDIPNTRGVRTDIIEALKAVNIPNLRWPGGCFADTYHWKDGIGPKEKRCPMVNYHWGRVIEDNTFGTHEFLNLCELLGCEAYISANVGSGTVREMSEWLEYITSDKNVPLANLRKRNGREKPWRIKFWGIGNESWGCGGNMSPEYYSDLFKQFATFSINYNNKDMVKVACGAVDFDYNWTDVLMKKPHWMMNGLSLHYYTVPGGWANKHPATGFDEGSYFEALQKGLRIDEVLQKHIAIMDKYDPEKRVGLMVDEWGIWCAVEEGTNPSFLYQQNSIRDALLAASTLNIFNKHCERVKMANIAQTVNVLQAMILTEGKKMVLTPTYHVFEMYKVHQDAALLPSIVTCSDYTFDNKTIPALNVSASCDKDETIHISINNLHPTQSQEIECELRGTNVKSVTGRVLTAKTFNTCNTFDNPDAVTPKKFKHFKHKNNIITLTLSPFSVVVLEVRVSRSSNQFKKPEMGSGEQKVGITAGGGFVAAFRPKSTPAVSIDTVSLLKEMVDFKNLAQRPEPFFKEAMASSYSRESHKGGDAWFDNSDVGQYVRTETNNGRKEHVLADLKGPGTITRFWSANPTKVNVTRFYFDGESQPRFEVPFRSLFSGEHKLFGPVLSYISGTGGNLYFPFPYATSLKITIEEKEEPLRLYYEICYRTYPAGTAVETINLKQWGPYYKIKNQVVQALLHPAPASAPEVPEFIPLRFTIPPGGIYKVPRVVGEKAVYHWSVRVVNTQESLNWDDPKRAHNAYRFLILKISFDGEKSIETPLGDFFGSAPGVNPYENLFFTVDKSGMMTSRLLMPFRKSMELSLSNVSSTPYFVDLRLSIGKYVFTERSYYLRAQWDTIYRNTWPHFDANFLNTWGGGKVVGTVYQIANPVLIWWGEGDQKIFIDGESFPSTFGTGTEDDYGFAYGYNRPFARPYHAQTRVDGPGSGGHISLNRLYVLDAYPYRKSIRFDQEMWHWMPCKPVWSFVIYWYARPGSPGPRAIYRKPLAPINLGIRENMLEPFEGEALAFETTGGTAEKQHLANCSRAEHLVWRDAKPADRLTVHFHVPKAELYLVELNLCMSPDYGRQKLFINGTAVPQVIDCYSAKLYWLHPKLGVFNLKEGDNILEVEALAPNPAASPGNRFGLDYIFLIRR